MLACNGGCRLLVLTVTDTFRDPPHFNSPSCSLAPLRWFNSTISERAHFSAYGTQHHPDLHNQPRPAPLTPYPHTQTHTLSSPSVFSPIFPYLPSPPHLPFFHLAPLLLLCLHHRCSFIWQTSYLSCLLSALAFWCWEERCVHGVGGGITCLCHRSPSGSR